MGNFLAKFAAAFWGELITLLIERGALAKLLDIIFEALTKHRQPKVVEASKPNKDDDDFKKNVVTDGWSTNGV